MQYIWGHRLYGESDKQLTDGRSVSIVHPGMQNRTSGPDFFNSMIDIEGVRWAGNIELHLRASDWHRHGHDKDRAYDSVVLHVVGVSDTYVTRTDGSIIPQLLLPFNRETAERYRLLAEGSQPLRCHAWLKELPRLNVADWLDSMATERLQEKSNRLLECVDYTNGDWSQALFIVLARALGFGLNGEPFEQLARTLPLSVAARHSNSLFQLEALLLGHAGLLANACPDHGDPYYAELREEYVFLAHKYSLKPLAGHIWKMSGVRPGNMPYRRLAYMARLLQGVSTLFSRIMDAGGDVERLLELFEVEFEGYWSRHLTFGPETARSYAKALSQDMAQVLLINVAAPLYHAYGVYSGDFLVEELGEKLLTRLPAEHNSVIKLWKDATGIIACNAFESQALLHVKRTYCEQSKCMNCRVGHRALRVAALGKGPV